MPDDVRKLLEAGAPSSLLPVPKGAYGLLNRHRGQFERQGYVHLPKADVETLVRNATADALLAAAEDLPVDSYGGGLRRRRYRTAMYYAWAAKGSRLRFDPPFTSPEGKFVPYFQPAAVNTDAGGQERRFAPLQDSLERDALLSELVDTLFALIPEGAIESRLPIRVGLHLIELRSDGRQACVPSPNLQHTDGEPYTAIVLIKRSHTTRSSARNLIATRRCANLHMQDIPLHERLYEVTMTEPLETIFCDDARVSHGVSGVLGEDLSEGSRVSLLIDFSDFRLVRTSEPHAHPEAI